MDYDIIKLARETLGRKEFIPLRDKITLSTDDEILEFANKIILAERRQCADKCERRADSTTVGSAVARQCAKDIRNGDYV